MYFIVCLADKKLLTHQRRTDHVAALTTRWVIAEFAS
jgi:hypothetical protein